MTVKRFSQADDEIEKLLMDNAEKSTLIGFNVKMQTIEFSWHLIKDQIVKNANCQQISV